MKITDYFKREKWTLVVVSIAGIFYNVGMIAGPWFEGQLVQRLLDIMGGKKTFADMVSLTIIYIVTILLVQFFRFLKRLYVRKFANHINRDMKQELYSHLVRRGKKELEEEGLGNLMTKAISDVDTCVEGMRKFTTEVFDTGIVMVAYIVMLLVYDWKLTLLAMLFPPVAYLVAQQLKGVVSGSASAYKKSAGRLNLSTMDRVNHAMTYRVYGQEENQNQIYEASLRDYERCAIKANIWETSMQPIYQIISTFSVSFILWFGAKNVLGTGWTSWNIAAFTTFLSCFTKLAIKSSKAAKLFNAVQKAKVSWVRVKPYLTKLDNTTPNNSTIKTVTTANTDTITKVATTDTTIIEEGDTLQVCHLTFGYGDSKKPILDDINFSLKKGEILGVAGTVASGKSTLGKWFLGEEPNTGYLGGVAYMGHKPELLSVSIEENILLGERGDVMPYLRAVCIEEEVAQMPEGIHTQIGNGGVTLSGGQQARIALARTLFHLTHEKELLILDDPFSAVDQTTQQQMMENIRPYLAECKTMLISHRLTMFPELHQVLWMGEHEAKPHEELMRTTPEYARQYRLQRGGQAHE